jgi:hypothetical protein
MLELNAASFYGVTSGLQAMREAISKRVAREKDETGDDIVLNFERDPVITKYLLEQIRELKANLVILGLPMTLKSANKFEVAVSSPPGFLWSSIAAYSAEIHERLRDELENVKVFVLGQPEAALFSPSQPLFGCDVAVKFPTEAAFEIDEASKCLALGRPTAAVFHLMRTMEVAVRAIARCLQIPDPLKPADRNWGAILGAIKGGVDAKWPTGASRMSVMVRCSSPSTRRWRLSAIHGAMERCTLRKNTRTTRRSIFSLP